MRFLKELLPLINLIASFVCFISAIVNHSRGYDWEFMAFLAMFNLVLAVYNDRED